MTTLAAAATGATVSSGSSRPLIGINFIQYQYDPPNCWGGHIILEYERPGVREVARALHAMRAAGVETLRLQVVFGPKPDPQWHWPIDSSSGHLIEPYRTNLARFLDDIRKAGFMQVTIQFNPWGPNDPIGYSRDPYDASLFDQNWTFMNPDLEPQAPSSAEGPTPRGGARGRRTHAGSASTSRSRNGIDRLAGLATGTTFARPKGLSPVASRPRRGCHPLVGGRPPISRVRNVCG